jgi:excisionase family DNA binding protein
VSNAENNRLMDIKAVASWTGLSVGTLYHLISQRRIPVVRISSRCVRFRLSDLEKWIAERVVLPINPLCSVTGKREWKGVGDKTAYRKLSGAQSHEREEEQEDEE